MQVNKSQADFLETMIDRWRQTEIITEEKAESLKKSYSVRAFDWKNIAKYAFVFAVISGVIAVIATFADRKLIRFFYALIDEMFHSSNLMLGLICAVVSFVFFYFGQKRKQGKPDTFFTNEGFILMGSAFATFTAANFANLSGKGDDYYITTFLLATILYIIISFLIKSQITWLLALVAFTCWVCVQSASLINWKPYFLGMNFVVRFFLYSLVFTGCTYAVRKVKILRPFYLLTFYYGLCLCFTALWAVSVCGNCGTWEAWNKITQIHFWPWALLSTGLSALAAYMGMKKNWLLLQNFGISFLLLNIYTRYFEYCWRDNYKSLFFLVMALSFWFIGRGAEKIWNGKGGK